MPCLNVEVVCGQGTARAMKVTDVWTVCFGELAEMIEMKWVTVILFVLTRECACCVIMACG